MTSLRLAPQKPFLDALDDLTSMSLVAVARYHSDLRNMRDIFEAPPLFK